MADIKIYWPKQCTEGWSTRSNNKMQQLL